MDTNDLRNDALEQVAAYIGYRPWREFCEMQDRAEKAERRAALLQETVRVQTIETVSLQRRCTTTEAEAIIAAAKAGAK